MSRKDRLSAFAEDIGFTVTVGRDVVAAEKVPCLLRDGIVSSCTIEKSFDPEERDAEYTRRLRSPCGPDYY